MQEAYEKAQKFMNMERELNPIKKETLTTPMTIKGNEKGSSVPKNLR